MYHFFLCTLYLYWICLPLRRLFFWKSVFEKHPSGRVHLQNSDICKNPMEIYFSCQEVTNLSPSTLLAVRRWFWSEQKPEVVSSGLPRAIRDCSGQRIFNILKTFLTSAKFVSLIRIKYWKCLNWIGSWMEGSAKWETRRVADHPQSPVPLTS